MILRALKSIGVGVTIIIALITLMYFLIAISEYLSNLTHIDIELILITIILFVIISGLHYFMTEA